MLRAIWPRVIDNARMVRNFVQVIRSGVVGRKSLGSAPKSLVAKWLESRGGARLFRDSVGNDPSLVDVIKLAHPSPRTPADKAAIGYLIGKPYDPELLPLLIRDFEAWKKDPSGPIPDVPFLMLTASPLDTKAWTEIARQASWQTIRMNLNTFERHGVLKDKATVKILADRLRDPDEIKRARVFPYQLLVAYRTATELPVELSGALQDAMEVATSNVPVIDGVIVVAPDSSGSMDNPVTGSHDLTPPNAMGRNWRSSASKVSCRDVSALIAATILRKNPGTIVLPFHEVVVPIRLNPRDSVMTIATQIKNCGSGGTSCSTVLKKLNDDGIKPDLVVYASDNESWIDTSHVFNPRFGGQSHDSTATMREWEILRHRAPKAKMVCIDSTPNVSKQAPTRKEILNVGGFSDAVFDVLAAFAKDGDSWVSRIESIDVSTPVPAVAEVSAATEGV